ncbi:hypothetical protein BHM03_00028795 [Ensete ventricosum]|uniref:Leucine-rich repeat-containing N-terminal plant-type domain-containing protein n=1 Tax=Ensete ventricosum TaxID=4639 RepID=A0A426XYH7_ENSVE|nr:hypothetical protein B296_00054671 [Ensete ventricosum]RZR99281.1 hypothetical protein BHM03_00028795 [Ensete ventricosum]
MDGSRASLAALFDLAPLLLLSTTLVAVTVASATTDSLDGTLSFVRLVVVDDNQFSGPVNILANLDLTTLNIANNQFNGWIPQEFKSITNLE